MNAISQTTQPNFLIRAAGGFAIVSGIISTIGIVFLLAMFARFDSPLHLIFGRLSDICVVLQYLLTIPIALALYQILRSYNPTLIRLATIVGIAMMLVVVALQLALIFDLLAFEQQVVWVSLAMIVGVGAWLMITGLVARSTGKLPHSVLMSSLAVPYLGYPAGAFWLGLHLLGW